MERPSGMGGFEFVVLASLRAAQLMRGCRPRVDGGHKNTVIAQREVSEGKVFHASGAESEEVTGQQAVFVVSTESLPTVVVD